MLREYYVYEYFIKDTQEVFYVGMGKGNRVTTDTRNLECEKIKKEFEWSYRIVQDNLTEQEASVLEIQKIIDYREAGQPLTNIKPGGVGEKLDEDAIAKTKYLVFLNKHNVIKMTHNEVCEETGVYSSLVSCLYSDELYPEIQHKVPNDIDDIIRRYNTRTYTEEEKKVGYIKYILELLDKGVIKMPQTQLASLFNMTPSNISSIKKEKTHAKIPAIVPDNIGYYLREYDINIISEEERKIGNLKFILRLKEEGVINIQDKQVSEILGVSSYYVADVKRPPDEKRNRYSYQEVRPDKDIIAKLTPFFVVKK
ncbi:GIY-YIG nuclease family protein [Bacillus sp. FJAT-42315]|uniref:GIY-YIG nuclease family protein n=1 Tax=Bacillus sp. FJAT-42315 TaxID=2014077 RepID=UPI000C234FB5|nr:GIY-YIG nuclease family protein [Bacillus sp. FJAT-42315]